MISLQSKLNGKGVSTPLPPDYSNHNLSVSKFFTELYGQMPKDFHIVLWRKSDLSSQFIVLHELEKVISKYLEDSQEPDLYFGVGLQKGLPVNANKRGVAADVVAIPGLWFDLDCANGKHSQTRLPTTDEAIEFLEWLPFGLPSIIVDSGGGYHLYWLFREPWLLENQREWEIAAKFSYDFQHTIKELGKRRGWEFDNTADLSRVLRVPGTVNAKGNLYKQVKVIGHDSRLRYNPSDFESYLMESNMFVRREPQGVSLMSHLQDTKITFDPIIKGCNWLSHCQTDAKTLPEPEWFAMLNILVRCENGIELAHEFSKPYPNYSTQETEHKFQHASTLKNVYSCRKINLLTGGKYCHTCHYQNKIQNPLDISSQDSLLEELNQLKTFLNSNHGG